MKTLPERYSNDSNILPDFNIDYCTVTPKKYVLKAYCLSYTCNPDTLRTGWEYKTEKNVKKFLDICPDCGLYLKWIKTEIK